jgi:hypothetical protein
MPGCRHTYSACRRVAIATVAAPTAGLLRQLVRVAGWLVLLSATVTLLSQPRLEHRSSYREAPAGAARDVGFAGQGL